MKETNWRDVPQRDLGIRVVLAMCVLGWGGVQEASLKQWYLGRDPDARSQWGQGTPQRANSKCKGPGVGMSRG